MNHSARLTTLAIATVIVLAGSLGEPSVALARRGRQIIDRQSIRLVLTTHPVDIKVCQDQVKTFEIVAEETYEYRYSTDPLSTRRRGNRDPQSAVRIQAEANDASVASVSPPFEDAVAPGFTTHFEVTGKDVGSTTIGVNDTLYRQRFPVPVETTECVLKISSTSNWTMDFNYPISAYGTMAAVTLHRTGRGVYTGQGTLNGQASGDPFLGDPHCYAQFRVGDSSVTITATLQARSQPQSFNIDLDYTRTTSHVTGDCPNPVRPVHVDKDMQGGKPLSMNLPRIPAFRKARRLLTMPHSISTDLGIQPGISEFVVWTEEVHP